MPSFLTTCLFSALVGYSAASISRARGNTTSIHDIGLSAGTVLSFPDEPDFQNDTARWSTFDRPRYSIYSRPALESDAQKLVIWATANEIPLLATGGTHGFATSFGRLCEGLQIDLSAFNGVTVHENGTFTVGGATSMGDVVDPLYTAGKVVPTGSEKCVGFVGGSLGGGVSRLNGLFGMIIDSLLEARLLTATGDIVTVSASANPDLFWAMKGAGFQYGIVLSATYQAHDLPNNGQVVNADFLFGANQSDLLFNYLQSVGSSLPAELAIIVQAGYNIAYGGTYLAVNAAYFGSMENATMLVQPLIDAGAVMQNITTVPYRNLLSTAFFGTAPANAPCAKGSVHNGYGLALKSFDVPTYQGFFQSLQDLYRTQPDAQASVWFIELFPNQAVEAVPLSSTAYPHRDAKTHLLFVYGYTNMSLTPTVTTFAVDARSSFVATSGYESPAVYVSYGHGDEDRATLYGSQNLPRLRELKHQWDPTSVFSFNQPLGEN